MREHIEDALAMLFLIFVISCVPMACTEIEKQRKEYLNNFQEVCYNGFVYSKNKSNGLLYPLLMKGIPRRCFE